MYNYKYSLSFCTLEHRLWDLGLSETVHDGNLIVWACHVVAPLNTSWIMLPEVRGRGTAPPLTPHVTTQGSHKLRSNAWV